MAVCLRSIPLPVALRINCSQMFLQVLETQLSHKQKTPMLLQCCQEDSYVLQLFQRH